MQAYPSRNQFSNDPASDALLTALEGLEEQLELEDSLLYRAFPLYKDDDGNVVMSDCLLLSPRYGVVAIAISAASPRLTSSENQRCLDVVEQVPPYIHSRLIKNRVLRRSPTQLSFEISPLIFAPLIERTPDNANQEVLKTTEDLESFFTRLGQAVARIPGDVFNELVGTIDGAKGLIRPKKRQPDLKAGSKGKQAEALEAAITLFDQQQKHGMMGKVTGPQRLRGLAGSGKTVVLAMKAAQAHLQNREAEIVYTFSTKALYQHVRRLITRFYRQFDDRDPDWDTLHVMHAWGGQSIPGVYSEACTHHNTTPIRFQDVPAFGDRFDYVCSTLLKEKKIQPIYDYVFVDEGQDFPLSFVRLTHALAKNGCFVLAYDDLQTIFQVKTPSTLEIFGADDHGKPKVEFEEDVVLYKCYRNPREILLAAHALGFGIYGRIVQMLESKEHWEDIGYEIKQGELKAGDRVIVERPVENSLDVVSRESSYDAIIDSFVASDMKSECDQVAEKIKANISEGLRPDDILVVCVDDRNAREYLAKVETALLRRNIQSNNLHNDTFGIRDFIKDDRVTLATVHKAKGNESFMVYVIGVDAVMYQPDVRKRNMLFTAMTRAKGWVCVSGVGEGAEHCKMELNKAHKNFPCLVFTYPKPEDVKRMRRDLAATADKRMRAKRMLQLLKQEYSEAELLDMIEEGERSSQSARRPIIRTRRSR